MALTNKLTAIGNAIRAKNGETALYTLDEMATAIGNLPSVSVKPVIMPLNVTENGEYVAPSTIDGYSPVTVNVPTGGGAGIPSEAFTISGDCRYRFINGGWDWFIKNYGDQVNTSNITNATSMFELSNIEAIPFTINLSNNANCYNMFNNCDYLKTLPEVSGKLNNFAYVFYNCHSLRQIPDSWGNLDFSHFTTSSSANMSNLFSGCYSLRQIPASLISNLHNDKVTSTYSKIYSATFRQCCSLDEILNFPVDGATLTSNMFSNTFYGCVRLKNMTFATNNGTPYIANWKTQTIDLTADVGYTENSITLGNVLNYNSGITEDKKVTDDTTYQALKDDPDWFTSNVAYSRYNHDSAVATINSLPDTSAYLATAGGTNTIKFKGNSGSATDGGAINTLTEEEIAVATAKGWTVTLV